MKNMSEITLILTVFGAIFYLLSSIAGVDLVSKITGGDRTIDKDFIRIIIGLSAIYILISSFMSK